MRSSVRPRWLSTRPDRTGVTLSGLSGTFCSRHSIADQPDRFSRAGHCCPRRNLPAPSHEAMTVVNATHDFAKPSAGYVKELLAACRTSLADSESLPSTRHRSESGRLLPLVLRNEHATAGGEILFFRCHQAVWQRRRRNRCRVIQRMCSGSSVPHRHLARRRPRPAALIVLRSTERERAIGGSLPAEGERRRRTAITTSSASSFYRPGQ